MSISKDDILFQNSTDKNGRGQGKYSYVGNKFITDFRLYRDGYILASEVLYDYYKTLRLTDNDKLDSIVYPLCFTYRQIVELYLKHFYFSYSGKTDLELQKFIVKVKHNLLKSWNETFPIIERLANKAGRCFPFDAIGSYIKQLDDFDKNSERMRYPYTNKLESTQKEKYRLDVPKLNQQICEFIKVLNSIDALLSYMILDNNIADSSFEDSFLKKFNDCKNAIFCTINYLESKCESKRREHNEVNSIKRCGVVDFASIEDNQEIEERNKLIRGLSLAELQMIQYLYYTGRDMNHYNIAKEGAERKKDVLYVFYNNSLNRNLDITNENKLYQSVLSIYGYEVLLSHINKAFLELRKD